MTIDASDGVYVDDEDDDDDFDDDGGVWLRRWSGWAGNRKVASLIPGSS